MLNYANFNLHFGDPTYTSVQLLSLDKMSFRLSTKLFPVEPTKGRGTLGLASGVRGSSASDVAIL